MSSITEYSQNGTESIAFAAVNSYREMLFVTTSGNALVLFAPATAEILCGGGATTIASLLASNQQPVTAFTIRASIFTQLVSIVPLELISRLEQIRHFPANSLLGFPGIILWGYNAASVAFSSLVLDAQEQEGWKECYGVSHMITDASSSQWTGPEAGQLASIALSVLDSYPPESWFHGLFEPSFPKLPTGHAPAPNNAKPASTPSCQQRIPSHGRPSQSLPPHAKKKSNLLTSRDSRALRNLANNPTLFECAAQALAAHRAAFPRGHATGPTATVVASFRGLPDAATIVVGTALHFVASRLSPRYIGSCLRVLQIPNPGGITGSGWTISVRFRRSSQSHRAARALARRLVFLSAQRGPAAAISISNID